jgi:hypothetical protein
VKGTALRASLRFLQERFGHGGVRPVLEKLDPNDQAELGCGVLDSVWYPMPLLLEVMRAAVAVHGEANPGLIREMGPASADVRGICKVFFKVGSPQFITGRASRVFSSYYDTGEIRVVESGSGRAVAPGRRSGTLWRVQPRRARRLRSAKPAAAARSRR